MTGSSWKHDRYINTQSACIRNTLESYVIFVFPDPSKRFPGSPCVIHCSVRVPHTAGTTEASRELDVEKWRAFIEKKKNDMKLATAFLSQTIRADGGKVCFTLLSV